MSIQSHSLKPNAVFAMKFFKYLTLSAALLFLGSCQDFLNVNNDPSRLRQDQVTIQTLLPSAIRFTANVYFGASQFGSQYPQYMGGQAISQYTPYGFDQVWRPLYTDALPTLQELISLSEQQGAFNYSGIGKLLLGLSLMLATDIYGDLPYKEANRGTANLNPCYDSMQELYEVHIKALLDGAIADMQRPLSNQPTLRTVVNDYIYNGNMTRWLRAAYAVRARYHLNLSKRNPALLAAAVADAQNAINNNADDLQLVYEPQVQNPWFTFLGNAVNKTLQPTSYIVGLMNGLGRYPGLFDPRLPIYMDNGPADDFTGSAYRGITPGRLIGDEAGVNVNFTANTWFSRNVAPLEMVTNAEVRFILAEAQFNTNRTAAYAAYLAGIRASMEKVGVPAASIEAYINNPQISMGAERLTLSDIMIQKYIALFLNMQTWSDMRRYQYNPNIYTGIAKPVVNQIPGEPWIQRSNIADDEPGVNSCIPKIPNQGVVLWLFQ